MEDAVADVTHGSLGAGPADTARENFEPTLTGKKKVCVVDRRRVGREGGEAADTAADLKPTYVKELEERVRRAESALKDKIAQLEEETRRSRQRLQQDLELRYEERERELLVDVLGILDDLGRACALASGDAAVAEGLRLIRNRIEQFLAAHDCAPFSPEGSPFDPQTMEAVTLQEGPEGAVTAVFQAGIRHRGALLRPAKVAVGKGMAGPSADAAGGPRQGEG